MTDINYPQKWLFESDAQPSTIGWYKEETYEMLKCQKGLASDPIVAENIYLIIPDIVDCNDIIPIQFKYLPRLASELDYDLTISDPSICIVNKETNNFEFLGKPGNVTIEVAMKTGGATFSKNIKVNKNATAVVIKEGNTFVQYVERDSTIELLPSDSTEKVLSISVWNNKDVVITPVAEEQNKFKIKCDVIGTYDLKINTDRKSYKMSIYFVEKESMLVNDISITVKPFYIFNEIIYIQPSFLPETATLKDYTVFIDNNSIATWNSGKNAIIIKEINGITKVVIQMINGSAKFEFDLKVQDPSSIILPENIEIVNLPNSIKEKEQMELNIEITPSNATIDDLNITSTSQASIINNNGVWYITGVSQGQATITLTSLSSNITKNYNIEVMPIFVNSINFTSIPNSILVGETHNFNVDVLPSNASNKGFDLTHSENVELSDTTIEGLQTFVISAITPGDAWIKAIAKDGSGFENLTTFKVDPILVQIITIDQIQDLYESDTQNFTISTYPDTATDKTYTITNSDNISIELISDNNYKLTANTGGAAWFTFTANDSSNVSKTISFNVLIKAQTINITNIPDEIIVGVEGLFNVEILPENTTNKNYTVTNSENVTVNGNNFVANAAGESWIRVDSIDGSSVYKTTNFLSVIKASSISLSGINSEMTVGDSGTFVVEVLPENTTNKNYTITNSENITITNNDFVVNTVGSAWIKATTNDGSNVSNTVNFEVIDIVV